MRWCLLFPFYSKQVLELPLPTLRVLEGLSEKDRKLKICKRQGELQASCCSLNATPSWTELDALPNPATNLMTHTGEMKGVCAHTVCVGVMRPMPSFVPAHNSSHLVLTVMCQFLPYVF